MGSVIKSTGSQLPSHSISNDDLSKKIDTSDEWIQQRTGIVSRYIVGDNESASSLATSAVEKAINRLESEGVNFEKNSIDLIVVGTVTADLAFPSVANLIQRNLGFSKAVAFDVNAACSGFIYALDIADKFLRSGQYFRAIVVGVDLFSKILDWSDRKTCILFGDGAGAAIVEYVDDCKNDCKDDCKTGILSSHIFSDGNYAEMLRSEFGVCDCRKNSIIMNGGEVFKFAVHKMREAIEVALCANGMKVEDINWLIPHQANKRIIASLIDYTKIDPAKVVQTVHLHANTSAASIPLALDSCFEKIKRGDLVLMVSMGAGFTWGATLIRW